MTDKIRNGGEWTEQQFHAFIVRTLRAGHLKWNQRKEALEASFVERRRNPMSGRQAKYYRCASCRKEFTAKNMRVDHCEPVVPVTGFVSWDDTINRMFCEAPFYQVLCVGCNKAKTDHENKLRKAARRETTRSDRPVPTREGKGPPAE